MLRTPQFYVMYVMFVLMATGGLLVTANAGPMAQVVGLFGTALTLAATLSPLANGASRIFWGWASDRLGRENTMIVTFVLQAICLVARRRRSGSSPAAWFAVTLVLVYFTWGQIYSLFPSTSGDYFGTRHATSNYARAVHRKGRGVDHRRLGRRAALRAVRQLDDGLLRQRRDGAGRGRHRRRPARRRRRSARARGEPCQLPRSESTVPLERSHALAERARRTRYADATRPARRRRRRARRSRSGRRRMPSKRELVRLRRVGRSRRPSASRSATPTRRCGACSSSTRWSGRTCTTTRCATPTRTSATLSLARMISPKIEPEIVFKLKAPLGAGITDAAAVLEAVEWLALGFEIIDCVYADWKFQPADFVAAYGLHAALVVGEPRPVDAGGIPAARRAAGDSSRSGCSKNGQLVAEGSGSNVAAQSGAVSRRAGVGDRDGSDGAEPLAAGRSGQLRHADRIARRSRRRDWTAVGRRASIWPDAADADATD